MLTVCSAALAGCGAGAGPKLAHTDAAPLISLAHRIASEDACAQARDIPLLQHRAIALVNSGRVDGDLRETLLSAAGALAAERPLCLPSVPAAARPPAHPAKPTGEPTKHEHGHGHHHDKGGGQ